MAASGLSRQRSHSGKNGAGQIPPRPSKGKDHVRDAPFDPCAATASLLLIAQGSTVLCLHHDTLAVERRFQKHTENIQLIAVDNVSESRAGRLVVTYDVGQTAIVWDLLTGDPISRFASYEPLTVASWMRNGNVSFGNVKGEVILFEPSSSEHVSARTIFDPITAIAPSSDCKTYAIGYNNGSILLAALQPSFTILHTLTTTRAPSPINILTWHASSSKQKSDMLATQTADGDLRVWSVSKPPIGEAPKVIRVLKRSDGLIPGRSWMSWSKNGRIMQFAEDETWAWDVRTKHVSYQPIQTVEGVTAIACHGPTGTLFTLGPDHTVQQYDIDTAAMVQNARHPPMTPQPTPPEENKQLQWTTSESEEELPSPVVQHRPDPRAAEYLKAERKKMTSPGLHSQLSGGASAGFRSSGARPQPRELLSPGNRSEQTITSISTGTQLHQNRDSGLSLTTSYLTQSPVSARPGRKASRLKQEVIMSPEEQPALDLFPFTRARLSDVPYRPPRSTDERHMTPDDLRMQMLNVIFGWDGDIHDLLEDELSRHPPNSRNAVFLLRWLYDDVDSLAKVLGSTDLNADFEWMLFGLCTMNNEASSKKITQVFTERMLSKGDPHAAATLLLAMGDRSDAIEVYVSRNLYLEATLLTCLLTPGDWQRISHLVRNWGEHVIENSQQSLAIRCFSCTGVEPTDPWTSPTAPVSMRLGQSFPAPQQNNQVQSADYNSQGQPYPAIYQKTLERRRSLDKPTPVAMPAPPTPFRTLAAQGTRINPQNSALKLITQFGPSNNQFRFPGLLSDDRTPTNGNSITPIAESAIDRSAMSPGGVGSYRLNNVRSINHAISNRVGTPGGFSRGRLPSIGETPVDVDMPSIAAALGPKSLPTPADSGSDKEKDRPMQSLDTAEKQKDGNGPLVLLTSARYEPLSTPVHETPQTALGPQTALKLLSSGQIPSLESRLEEGEVTAPRIHLSSKAKKPDGLSIKMAPIEKMGAKESQSRGPGYGDPSQGPQTGESYTTSQMDTASSLASPPTTGNSQRSAKGSINGGRSLDQYISSLEQAQYYTHQSRPRGYSNGSKQSRDERTIRKKSRNRQQNATDEHQDVDDRRGIPSAKRSPSSPIPMSPEDVRMYSASVESFDSMYAPTHSTNDRTLTPVSQVRSHRRYSGSTREGRHRQRSSSRQLGNKSKNASRNGSHSRPRSPEVVNGMYRNRGRSASRKDSSGPRSPSSPLPMVPSEEDRQRSDIETSFRFVNKDRQRNPRSSSRRPERSSSARQERSPDRRRHRARSGSQQSEDIQSELIRKNSQSARSDRSKHRKRRDASHGQPNMSGDLSDLGMSAQVSDGVYNLSTDQESRPGSRPYLSALDRTRKELAAAELEARRLSLARRTSIPGIPLPGQGPVHGKSASLGQAPALLRSHTDTGPVTRYNNASGGNDSSILEQSISHGSRGRPGTPRAMQVTPNGHSEGLGGLNLSNIGEVLTSTVYQPAGGEPISRPGSTRAQVSSPEVLAQVPKHPAYDHRIGSSRASSKGRTRSRSRAASRERPRVSPRDMPTLTVGSPDSGYAVVPGNEYPPLLPELAHLIPPPPPPPPPPAPPSQKMMNGISPPMNLYIETDTTSAASIPLPPSALSGAITTPGGIMRSGSEQGHRRGRSGNESSQIVGKIRNFADRMRSTSRGRDNTMRTSPRTNEDPMPYETGFAMPPPPQVQSLASVMER